MITVTLARGKTASTNRSGGSPSDGDAHCGEQTMSEFVHWCGNCQIRVYIRRHYDYDFNWQNCPYVCEYATQMREWTKQFNYEREESVGAKIEAERKEMLEPWKGNKDE